MNKQERQNITKTITAAVKEELGEKWGEAQDFAKSESKKLAENVAEIALWKKKGKITEEQAKVLLRMHKRSMKMVLTSLEGISLVLAERAIKAAIDAIGGIVNKIVGWKLF